MSSASINRPPKHIRVLIVAKFRITREGLKSLLDTTEDLKVVGTRGFTGNEVDKGSPHADVALVDFNKGDRIEIISELQEQSTQVVIVVDGADLETQSEALKRGALGIVQKDQSAKLLTEAIRRTHQGETWLNQVLLNKLLQKGAKSTKGNGSRGLADFSMLTQRELEVLAMIGEGLKNKNIAERLFISEATVRHHLSTIYGKTGVEDRLNLVIFAYQTGLLGLSDRN